MQRKDRDGIIAVLEEELVPALGCTEPAAVAYAAARAREILGSLPERAVAECSGNIVKNVKSVTVPHSGGLRGIEAAVTLGIVGGDPSRKLEVLTDVTDGERLRAKRLLLRGFCTARLADGVDRLYIKVTVFAGEHRASVTVEGRHTNITSAEKDGRVLFRGPSAAGPERKREGDRTELTVASIFEFAETVPVEAVRSVLDRQIACNDAIADEGIRTRYGSGVAQAILSGMPHTPFVLAQARAAAASEARMSGCPLPAVINSGSGNQGILVSVPVAAYARRTRRTEETLYRSLLVSNLVSIHVKRFIGDLSAFCGAVTAACGVSASFAYMEGLGLRVLSDAVSNTLASASGIFCDGAKPSCGAKVALALESAYLSYLMARDGRAFEAGDGIVGETVEDTIRGIGRIGRLGMEQTDETILEIMMRTRTGC